MSGSPEYSIPETPIATFIGGGRTRDYVASWPLVEMELFRNSIRIQLRARLLRRFIPAWEANFDEIADISAVGRIRYLDTYIRFRLTGSAKWAMFFSISERSEIMDALTTLGLEVQREPDRFHFINPSLD